MGLHESLCLTTLGLGASIGFMKKLPVLLLSLLAQAIFTQDLELPYFGDASTITRYAGFVLKYNEQYEQAEWVAYQCRLTSLGAQTPTGKWLVIEVGDSPLD